MTTMTPRTRVRGITLRAAVAADMPAIQAIVLKAARGLLTGTFLTPDQLAGAERAGLFDLDTNLVAAGTYYVIEIDGVVVAGSGWSAGGPAIAGAHAAQAADDTAVMRASYVDPEWARRGLASLLARTTETVARLAGFTRFEALCTPPSEALRRSLGYELVSYEQVEFGPGLVARGARMRKILG